MKVCVGGTFNILHKGHELLFNRAFQDDNHVFIGLTSHELIKGKKEVQIDDFETRRKRLEEFLRGKGWGERHTIMKLNDVLGPAVSEDFDAIIVSEDTRYRAEEINRMRGKNHIKPLKILLIEMAKAQNGDVISATKIKKGEMDANGTMMRTIIVCVGSENKVKINAVENVFSKLFRQVLVKGINVETKVPEQPMEKDVIDGAMERAKASATEECDFGVGIEAGLFFNKSIQRYFDVQYCAVIDKSNRMSLGHGSGFCYPPEIIEVVKRKKTISQAIEERYGIKDVGSKEGAVGYLSKGMLNRTKLTEQAVLMAMIPRIRRELYE